MQEKLRCLLGSLVCQSLQLADHPFLLLLMLLLLQMLEMQKQQQQEEANSQ